MNFFIGIVLTIIYFAIGIFIAKLTDSINVDNWDDLIWIVLFWPMLILTTLVVMAVIYMPEVLDKLIHKQIDDEE